MADTASGTGAMDLQDRLEFLGMDARARATLRDQKPTIEKALGPALDAFYARIRQVPELRRFFSDDRQIADARRRQEQHWQTIANADFGADYAKKVNEIGQTHARIGLEPRWYIGGYAMIADGLIQAVAQGSGERSGLLGLTKGRGQGAGEALSAVIKAVMLDLDLAIATYLETLQAQSKRAEEARALAERNQAEALRSLGTALDRLASGDLRTRMEEPVSAEFEKLKANFNATVAKLQQAMQGVNVNSRMISAGSREIANAADDLSKRTEQQASSLEQTAAALDQITATVKKAAEGAAHARDVVATAKGDAEKGGSVVRKAVEAMGSIEKSSTQISQIIGVIDEIAFQTNLLALNAGVEAARAGEAGRGFAVVASEVRALAQRSAEAAKEIKGLISASTAQVEEGVELVAETGKSLERIMTQVLDINSVVINIASGSQEQSTGLQEVNSAVNQMDQMTQQNAAMVEETTAASHSLLEKTAELDRLISSFKLGDQPASDSVVAMRQERAKSGRPPAAAAAMKSAPGRQTSAAVRKPEAQEAEGDWQDF